MNNEELTEVVLEIATTIEEMATIIEKMALKIVDLHKRVETLENWKDNG